MSAAPVIAERVYSEAEKNTRLHDLWRWLVGLGVCDTCASTWALARVEREMGDRQWKPWPFRCEKRNRRGQTCRDLAAEHKGSMPLLEVTT